MLTAAQSITGALGSIICFEDRCGQPSAPPRAQGRSVVCTTFDARTASCVLALLLGEVRHRAVMHEVSGADDGGADAGEPGRADAQGGEDPVADEGGTFGAILPNHMIDWRWQHQPPLLRELEFHKIVRKNAFFAHEFIGFLLKEGVCVCLVRRSPTVARRGAQHGGCTGLCQQPAAGASAGRFASRRQSRRRASSTHSTSRRTCAAPRTCTTLTARSARRRPSPGLPMRRLTSATWSRPRPPSLPFRVRLQRTWRRSSPADTHLFRVFMLDGMEGPAAPVASSAASSASQTPKPSTPSLQPILRHAHAPEPSPLIASVSVESAASDTPLRAEDPATPVTAERSQLTDATVTRATIYFDAMDSTAASADPLIRLRGAHACRLSAADAGAESKARQGEEAASSMGSSERLSRLDFSDQDISKMCPELKLGALLIIAADNMVHGPASNPDPHTGGSAWRFCLVPPRRTRRRLALQFRPGALTPCRRWWPPSARWSRSCGA